MTAVYDIVIIGGGAAGFTAGIYAARDRCQALLLERVAAGGRCPLRPGRHQGQAQDVLVKVARSFLVARDPGGMMQPPRSAHIGADCRKGIAHSR